jgi:beta-1,4-N-acetylglucosaminyltransferase
MKSLLVTVGTTEFEELIKNIDSIQFLKKLNFFDFTKLYIQIGRGKYEPKILVENGYNNNISIEYFRFTDNLPDYIKKCDLIISHCGAGSILEIITLKKQLIVVINNS